MEPYWSSVEQIIRESDIVLEVLDARMVELSRNRELERLIKEIDRPRIFVINKSDLVDTKELVHPIEKLMQERNAYVVFVSNKETKAIKMLIAKIKWVFNKHGKRKTFIEAPMIQKPYREAKGDVVIGVVGYPNVGKSSIINGLAFKKKMQVSSKAGTTHGVHWISIGDHIRLIDTPGVIPLEYTEEAKLGIISARSPEKMKDPESAAGKIIAMFIDNGKLKKFEEYYKVKFEGEKEELKDPYYILRALTLLKRNLKHGGEPDETRMSMTLLRDWQNGKLKL